MTTIKLSKNQYPPKHSPTDFEVLGAVATIDGQFDQAQIADLGCFNQDGKDSNKFYHACVCQSKKTQEWFVYFEFGRTGNSSTTFQFELANSKDQAQTIFAKQLHAKNDKRGEWKEIGGVKVLTAKKDKDCYLVRPMATRTWGLPEARKIKINEVKKIISDEKTTGQQDFHTPTTTAGDPGTTMLAVPSSTKLRTTPTIDPQTASLLRDLTGATLSYVKSSMADASLPSFSAIEEGRQILLEAQKRLLKAGDSIDQQVKDQELIQLTNVIYSRIPKKKKLHCAPQDWILNQGNIIAWRQDLDCYESALSSVEVEKEDFLDPYMQLPIEMEWLDPKSELGTWLYQWWPKARSNRASGDIRSNKSLKIKNLWKCSRKGEVDKMHLTQELILADKKKLQLSSWKEVPANQPSERLDLKFDNKLLSRYAESNTGLLFHGTKSCNVTGIMRTGFRLPKELVGVSITGANYGDGIYMADSWPKSSNYTSLSQSYYAHGSGGITGRGALMFACDSVIGNTYVAPRTSGYKGPPKDYHSIFGKADVSGVINNEWVFFSTDKINLRYLIEFEV